MIKQYITERLSWILLVLFLQVLLIFIADIDASIPLNPILYIVFLSLIIFSVFFMIRCSKESKFYKSLADWETHLDLTGIVEAESPFEKIVERSIIEQTERLKQEAAANRIALEQEKDDLLAWIHEVKTPLTAMHLMIDRLDDETMKARLTYEWLRIHLLLDQQLHQKRILFIENDLYMEKVALNQIIFKEIKDLQSWCMQKGIGFEVDLTENEVLSDAKWLAFIIRQLLTNAVKYSEASDIWIKGFRQDGQTALEVKDFGRGIASQDLPRIFDKGFTSTAVHQDSAATGMGLYLAKKVCQSLMININIESEHGVGTTVILTFPQQNDFLKITGI